MGDAGSLFLGFVIAVLLLKLRGNAPTRVPVAVILAIPGVALFDTTLVTISRLAHRRSPFQGGKDHTSHRLLGLGFSVRQAVGTIYTAGALLGWAAVGMAQLGDSVRFAGTIALLLVASAAAWPLIRPHHQTRRADRDLPLSSTCSPQQRITDDTLRGT